jgi:rhamnosyltransferase
MNIKFYRQKLSPLYRETVDVSIIIVGKNESVYVKRCLEAVFSQSGNIIVEVIFIDSGSKDGTLDIVSLYPVKIVNISPESFHHSKTRNLGAQLSGGEFVVFLNADAVPQNDIWLKELMIPFANSKIMATHSRLIPRKDAWLNVKLAYEWNYANDYEIRNADSYKRLGLKIFFFSTVSSAVRKSFFNLNPFSDDIPIFEDRYLAFQIIRQGLSTAYCPNSTVEHSHNIPPTKVFRRYFDLGMIDKIIGIHDCMNGEGLIVKQSVGHFIYECKRVIQNKFIFKVFTFILFDFFKYMGYFLGKNYSKLPGYLTDKISLVREKRLS